MAHKIDIPATVTDTIRWVSSAGVLGYKEIRAQVQVWPEFHAAWEVLDEREVVLRTDSVVDAVTAYNAIPK